MRRLAPAPRAPAVLVEIGKAGRKETDRAIDIFGGDDWDERRKAERFEFKAYGDAAVRLAVTEAFHGKCCYCESYFASTQSVAVEHYRPKGEVELDDGRPKLRPGYYWLAATWQNLLPSCTDCNSERWHVGPDGRFKTGKANWFPVAGDKRARLRPGSEKGERPLLLHPYRDDPSKHLEFGPEAVVRPRKDAAGRRSAKGTATIAILGLNRPELVEARLARLVFVLEHLERIAEYEEDLMAEPNEAKHAQRLARELAQLSAMTGFSEEYSEMVGQRARAMRPD